MALANIGNIAPYTITTYGGNNSSNILGGGGGGGYYWSTNTITLNNTIKVNGDRLEFVTTNDQRPKIVTNKHVIDIDLLYETVQLLAERLAILAADEDILAKYPTLRDAYEHYQLLNSLINPTEKDE